MHILKDSSKGPLLYRWSLDNIPNGAGPSADRVPREHPTGHHDPQRIYILGLGNLGRLFATSLAKLPVRPRITLVVHRMGLLEQWQANPGVEMTRSGVADIDAEFDIEMWSDEPPSLGPTREVLNGRTIPNLIVTTKAPDALPQVDKLRRYLGPESAVVFAQNGMSKFWPPYGSVYSAARFPPGKHPNWLTCVVTHGVTSIGPFRSVHASPADMTLGIVLPNESATGSSDYLVQQILNAPYLAARQVPRSELFVLQLEKLVVNAVINPLTALLRCKNGDLFSEPGGDVAKLMDTLLREASGVLQRLVQHDSVREVLPAGHPGSLEAQVSAQGLVERFSFTRLREMVYRVGDKVRDNTSSMLQDVRAGKPTEIREFNGWLVDTSRYLDSRLDVTSLQAMVDLVEGGVVLEKSRLGNYFPALHS